MTAAIGSEAGVEAVGFELEIILVVEGSSIATFFLFSSPTSPLSSLSRFLLSVDAACVSDFLLSTSILKASAKEAYNSMRGLSGGSEVEGKGSRRGSDEIAFRLGPLLNCSAKLAR